MTTERAARRAQVSPVTGLHTGQGAFDAALNTVNIGKFNLCFGGIGAGTHALCETITHAQNRILYGHPAQGVGGRGTARVAPVSCCVSTQSEGLPLDAEGRGTLSRVAGTDAVG